MQERHRTDDRQKALKIKRISQSKNHVFPQHVCQVASPCLTTAIRRSTLPTCVSPEPPQFGVRSCSIPQGASAQKATCPYSPAGLQVPEEKAIQLALAAFGLHWLAALADRAPAAAAQVHQPNCLQPFNHPTKSFATRFRLFLSHRLPRADHNTRQPRWPMRSLVIISEYSCIACPQAPGRV